MSAKSRETASPAATAVLGRLYVVGTPIGNLEDITIRALRILKEVDFIACEDTRRTQQLLDRYDIKTPLVSYHEHNELTRAPELIIRMEEGASIALVSDAGMPLVADPGYRLVKLAMRHSIPVVPVPGASAFVAVLAAAGLPVNEFRFMGFLPSKRLARLRLLKELQEERTVVFYEAPHRVVETLEDVLESLGDRPLVLAREVTKLHEEFLRGPVSEVLLTLKARPVKGEITLVLGPQDEHTARPARLPERSIRQDVNRAMSERGLDERAALKTVAKARGISKSEAYRRLQSEKGGAAN